MIDIENRPSPNHDARPVGTPIDMLVLHYTGMTSGNAALDRLCDDAAKVSAHYVVEEDGRVFRLVTEDRRAWHAGVASWRGNLDINARSIGIELVNPGHEYGYRAFPDAQMHSLEEIARDVVRRHAIPNRNIVGHSDVAPMRKEDPGELFDWPRLARAGVGCWPEFAASRLTVEFEAGERSDEIATVQKKLSHWGYDLPTDGHFDERTVRAVIAFQRHFRPRCFDGRLDGETIAWLDALLTLID